MAGRIDARTIGLVLAALVLAWGAWHWAAWRHKAAIAAGFGARIACSCRYVEGRGMASCRTDLAGLPDMRLVRLADRPDIRAVEGSVPFLGHRRARVVTGFGCVMDPE